MSGAKAIECLPCEDSAVRAEAARRQLGVSREVARALGQSAVSQVEHGSYLAPSGRRIAFRAATETAIQSKRSIPPDEVVSLPAEDPARCTRIQVCNETTLQAARRLHDQSLRPLALNFANGATPGGGFLNGARAQEEVLCRSSALHATLVRDPMYAYHRGLGEPTSSDWIILSPQVPVFRDDAGSALEEPWLLDVVTCAAPFAPKIGACRSGDLLRTRIARLLGVAAGFGYEDLVLGAWGCGVFANDPARTALDFRNLLEGEFSGRFTQVVFAIADWSPERKTLGHFRDVFSERDSQAIAQRTDREYGERGAEIPADHDLKRFIDAQELAYPAAIQELREGQKRTHWMWFVLPQVEGLGSSWQAQQYAIESIHEARAYLQHPVLGQRLLECIEVLLRHRNKPIEAVLGDTDAAKYRSCLTLFESAGGPALVSDSLDAIYAGARCDRTLAVLGL
jgi:uncharacterized protein (TIGR02452 family)